MLLIVLCFLCLSNFLQNGDGYIMYQNCTANLTSMCMCEGIYCGWDGMCDGNNCTYPTLSVNYTVPSIEGCDEGDNDCMCGEFYCAWPDTCEEGMCTSSSFNFTDLIVKNCTEGDSDCICDMMYCARWEKCEDNKCVSNYTDSQEGGILYQNCTPNVTNLCICGGTYCAWDGNCNGEYCEYPLTNITETMWRNCTEDDSDCICDMQYCGSWEKCKGNRCVSDYEDSQDGGIMHQNCTSDVTSLCMCGGIYCPWNGNCTGQNCEIPLTNTTEEAG